MIEPDPDEEWIPPSVIAKWKEQVAIQRSILFDREHKWCEGPSQEIKTNNYRGRYKKEKEDY